MNQPLLSFFLGFLLFPVIAAAAEPEPPLQDSEFAGAWRITGGVPAGIDDGEPATAMPALIGVTIVFNARTIDAPHPLGCTEATYEIRHLAADMLFQGTLGDDAPARAQALDLSPTAAPTLMAQCETGLFDYHLTQGSGDAAPQLLIMLDRVIYALERDVNPTTTDR